jgi:hypothetical protein
MNDTPKMTKTQKYVKLSMQVLLIIGLISSIITANWMNVLFIIFIIILTSFPTIFAHHYKIILPTEFELGAILFIFGSLFLGSTVGFYHRFWWWDVLLHGFSAILLGIIGLLMVWILNHNEKIDMSLNPLFICVFSFSFAVAIGALWEIYEFTIDNIFDANMQKSGLVDTMWDLIIDTTGAFIVSVAAYVYYKTGHKSRIINEIQEFLSLNKSFFHNNK